MHKNEQSKLKALSDIASIDLTSEFNEILQNILKITYEAINASSAALMLIDENDEQPRMAASIGLPHEPSFSSWISTPMKMGSKVIGLLNVYMTQVHRFTEEEINFLTIAASWASSVVQSAEKKKQELALKESEERYRDLFENAPDCMYINDAMGYVLHINKTGLEMLGCSAKDVIGTHASQWFTPESFRLTQDTVYKRALGEPADDPMIRQVVTRSGERRWVEIRSRMIKDGDRVMGFQGIIRDITDKVGLEQKVQEYQKQLERSCKEIKETEKRYREIFDNANDSIYIYDSEGYFKEVNSTALELLGCTKEEIIGSPISRWIAPESLKLAREKLEIGIKGEPFVEKFVLEVICKNGEHRWMEIKGRLINDGERVVAVHGIGRDITETKRLKQKLKESDKQLKLLWHLMTGTRGGNTRASILKYLSERPYNANQLAEALNLDYKTVRHHLDVLLKNGIITKGNGYTALYFISKNIESDLNSLIVSLQCG